ncbi:MAG: DUF5606 domain-containing protein [Bacteroidota bacterium]
MDLLKEVAHISGKGGLFRIIKPTRAGVIVEAIDETHARAIFGANSRVSVLKEISVYTDTQEGSVSLAEVLTAIFDKYGKPVDIDPKTASESDLAEFFGGVLPDYDRGRVYNSDIKKIITWYNTLVKHLAEIFVKQAETAVTDETTTVETKETEAAEKTEK